MYALLMNCPILASRMSFTNNAPMATSSIAPFLKTIADAAGINVSAFLAAIRMHVKNLKVYLWSFAAGQNKPNGFPQGVRPCRCSYYKHGYYTPADESSRRLLSDCEWIWYERGMIWCLSAHYLCVDYTLHWKGIGQHRHGRNPYGQGQCIHSRYGFDF